VKRVAEGRGRVVELGAVWLRVQLGMAGREVDLDLPVVVNE